MIDKKELIEQVSSVVSYSQGIADPQVGNLIDRWCEAKRDIIEFFGGELIKEYPQKVSFEIGDKEKKIRISDFIDIIDNRYENRDLANFVNVERDGFFTNTVIMDYDYKGTKIKKGMKLLRAFKFFEKDKEVINQLQSAASMIIQENKIEGTLCLSIHPLDYLSSSENNHNWRSCHALDGEYRAGNLSYMLDNSTVICYLRSEKMEKLPDFPDSVPWNSKKWRVLLFLSEYWDMMFAGRQYPFSTESGIDFVKDKFLPYLGLDNWTSWHDKQEKVFHFDDNKEDEDVYFNSPYVPVGRTLRSMEDLVEDADGSLHFNDLLHSSCYTPMYAYKNAGIGIFRHIITRNDTKFKIGGKCNCLRCNKSPITLTESFMCEDCELNYGESDSETFGTCPCCGRRFVYDDGSWVTGAEEQVCDECFRDYVKECDCCGEYYYKDDLIYDRKTEQLVCKYCYEEIQEEKE